MVPSTELTALQSGAFQSETSQIGEVSIRSGLPVKTIRYYTDIGLLNPQVRRSPSGYRLYESDVLNRLTFIRRTQALGLSLSEIRDILEIHDHGNLPCGLICLERTFADCISGPNHLPEFKEPKLKSEASI
jgi:DNA-binding transcriptional MerR regulator